MSENYFKELYDVDVRAKTKQKNGLNYLSWSAAWAEVKKRHPEAIYNIYDFDIMVTEKEENKETSYTIHRPWHTDGKTGWVKVGVIINEIEHIEELPIMDLRNKPIAADNITSAEANKSIQRALTKACARHGLGLYLYEGEDVPEEAKISSKLQQECMELIKKKATLSESTKKRVAEICKEALPDENGDPTICEDNEKLEALKKKLLALRKIADESKQ